MCIDALTAGIRSAPEPRGILKSLEHCLQQAGSNPQQAMRGTHASTMVMVSPSTRVTWASIIVDLQVYTCVQAACDCNMYSRTLHLPAELCWGGAAGLQLVEAVAAQGHVLGVSIAAARPNVQSLGRSVGQQGAVPVPCHLNAAHAGNQSNSVGRGVGPCWPRRLESSLVGAQQQTICANCASFTSRALHAVCTGCCYKFCNVCLHLHLHLCLHLYLVLHVPAASRKAGEQ